MMGFLFFILPLLVALTPLYIMLEKVIAQAREERLRDELTELKIQEKAERLQFAREMREAKTAKEHNAVMLQEIKIETEQMKQRQLKQKLGLTAEEFKPQNYE